MDFLPHRGGPRARGGVDRGRGTRPRTPRAERGGERGAASTGPSRFGAGRLVTGLRLPGGDPPKAEGARQEYSPPSRGSPPGTPSAAGAASGQRSPGSPPPVSPPRRGIQPGGLPSPSATGGRGCSAPTPSHTPTHAHLPSPWGVTVCSPHPGQPPPPAGGVPGPVVPAQPSDCSLLSSRSVGVEVESTCPLPAAGGPRSPPPHVLPPHFVWRFPQLHPSPLHRFRTPPSFFAPSPPPSAFPAK